jgi:monothiol glutaredoxin
MDVMDRIKDHIENNSIVIFMKGTPQFPMCGFSSRAVEALKQCGQQFAYVNVLAEPDVRQALPQYSEWPTFPQVFIGGELIGGCDITLELFEKGELQKMTAAAAKNTAAK